MLLPVAPWTLAGIGLLLLSSSFPNGVPQETPPAAALEWIGGDTHAFGTVVAGEIIEHTFVWISAGEADLIIRELVTDCACTTFQVFRIDTAGKRTPYETGTPLPPGDTVELAVRIDTTDKIGDLSFNVRFELNAPERFTAAKSQLQCVSPFRAAPQQLPLGELFPDQNAAGTVRITNVFAEPFKPELEVNKFSQWIGIEMEPVEPNQDGLAKAWDVHLEVNGDLPPKGNNNYPLHLSASLPNKAQFASANSEGVATFRFQVQVGVNARKWIECEPRTIEFGRLWAKRKYKRTITITNNDDEFELEIGPTDVSLSGYGQPFAWAENTALEIHALESGDVQITVTVSGLPQRMKEPFQGYLSIAVGHPSSSRIDVPLIGQHR